MQAALQCPKPDWSLLSTILVILIVTGLRKNWLIKTNLYINIEVLLYSVLRVLRGSKIFVFRLSRFVYFYARYVIEHYFVTQP